MPVPVVSPAFHPDTHNYTARISNTTDRITVAPTAGVANATDLINWQLNTVTPTVIADDGEVEAVSVPYPANESGAKARFFRVTVSH